MFKISPAFGGDLVIDENGIKFEGNKLLTSASLQGIKDEIKDLWTAIGKLQQ